MKICKMSFVEHVNPNKLAYATFTKFALVEEVVSALEFNVFNIRAE